MQTKDVGRLFFQKLYYRVDGPPLLGTEPVTEIEAPWRRATGLVFRVPLTKLALVIGWWGKPGNEDANLRTALKAREAQAPNTPEGRAGYVGISSPRPRTSEGHHDRDTLAKEKVQEWKVRSFAEGSAEGGNTFGL
jgi:hypothetical protein